MEFLESSCATGSEKSNISDPDTLSALLYRPYLISRRKIVPCQLHPLEPELMELMTFSRLVPLLPYLKPFSLKKLTVEPRYVYYLLNHSKDYFSLFKASDFYKFLSSDDLSKYYAILCIGLLTGMVDKEQQQMINNYIRDTRPVLKEFYKDNYKQSLDLLLLFNYQTKPVSIQSDKIADLCGVYLPKQEREYNSSFVLTETSSKILYEIGLALSCEMPILLQGHEGSGKTALVEEAGRILGCQDLLKIHLGDQTDSKLLLGTYMTTSTPGVFKWQPGILTTAVAEGRWLLIEDIDLAPVDVISVLLPLLETRWLHVQSRGERHYAKDGFKIFATKRTANKSIGENLWTNISVPEMQLNEIQQILSAKFPEITDIQLIINIYDKLKTIFKDFARQLSIRDLIKWCERIVKVMDNQQFNELVFREAFDCILGMIPKEDLLFSLAVELGKMLELSEHRVEYYIYHHLPALVDDKTSIQIGRVHLPKIKQIESSAPFASTSASLRLLEKLAMCVLQKEPILLVGETGTGKTTVVQKLASQLGHKLTVINMSQQSDSTDLLGGFKPVDQVMLIAPLKEKFDELFSCTFSVKSNSAFLDSINKYYSRKKCDQVLVGFNNAIKMAEKVQTNQKTARLSMNETDGKKKARKVLDPALFVEWEIFQNMTREFQQKMQQIKSNFLFSFVEGSLVQAMKNGHWILLDEINLATAETLECLSGLLQSPEGSILLLERGDVQPIKRHPNFRIFGCMNPANDAGKRNLPSGLRSRFTEFWVNSPDANINDLLLVIKSYIYKFLPAGPSGEEICRDIAEFYTQCKKLAVDGMVFDGADQRVHISMRTLTRALSCASFIAPTYGIRRSLYEGCFMTFMTGLSTDSFKKLYGILETCILNTVRNPQAFIKQIPQKPDEAEYSSRYTLVDSFWLEKGPLEIPENLDNQFVLTPSVKTNLANLARGCLSRKYPILIQGPTSAGKTSMIEYLAKCTGHRFIRINNHEHTDLQEYLGGYMSNNEGVLVFQEGVLVEALRKGYWIVLDELNLAPSDVLEALNRLLDDNRELFLAEKQEVIKPHPHFMLFATQNPAGQYGGRKQLSRAFRNRFLELHFTDIPEHELETILEKRCQIAPSYAKKCVAVYKQLSQSRDASRIFQGRQSFITLRDLFRWALRKAVGYEALAEDGYMLIAERVRKQEDRQVIQKIIEKELRVKLDMDKYYNDKFNEIISQFKVQPSVVWTKAMKKLFVLIYNSTIFAEPVLLIGETGCGKTTVCQLLASLFSQELHIVNAHQNSETSDFLGSQRPSRNRETYEAQLRDALKGHQIQEDASLAQIEEFVRDLKTQNIKVAELESLISKSKALFEWHDGPLVQAMQRGDIFLLDEISLADDSVLERLNSVLEPSRQLTLVEKNGLDIFEIKAHEKFQFFATMNPGGDYGKKELSPALRNRFTEIWVPQISDKHDLQMIISNKMRIENSEYWANKILEFLDWYAQELNKPIETIVSLRDVLAWAGFIVNVSPTIGIPESFYHGGCMVLIDGMGVNPLLGIVGSAKTQSKKARETLLQFADIHTTVSEFDNVIINVSEASVGVEPFVVPFGNCPPKSVSFALQAPTTLQNCVRVLRSMQLSKPILLEGSPGAGKTSLVTSLAAISRHNLIRINLSEQTDLMDLFGSDLPVEGGNGGEFSWRDGPFLKAMQDGDWVLLDELNLASQQVLEGLNACLDHRATVYIPELDKHFSCHPDFRVFAAQNPQSQGGGRKGLPKSFVNRFTLVYVEELTKDDLVFICKNLYPQLPSSIGEKMIEFNEIIKRETMDLHNFGWLGSPWEFNLRDILRWIELMIQSNNFHNPAEFLNILYVQRMRTEEDRECVRKIYNDVFGELPEQVLENPFFKITDQHLIVGNQIYDRTNNRGTHKHGIPVDDLQIMLSSLPLLQSLVLCVKAKTTALIVGPTACGKSSLVRLLAQLCGEKLEEFSLNPGVDALELLGGFEQVDLKRCEQDILDHFSEIIETITRRLLLESNLDAVSQLNEFWDSIEANEDSKRKVKQLLELLESLRPFLNDEGIYVFLQQKINNYSRLTESGTGGQFEWMDSTLITALERGYWLLIDNVNLCSSSVLDRLNSLLEVGGTLAVNERGLVDGQVKIITPHPNFRIFMTMDPRHGEISRAMRNRSIELYITDFYDHAEYGQVDVMKLLTEYGLPGIYSTKAFVEAESQGLITKSQIKLAVERLRRGQAWNDVFAQSGLEFSDISPEELLVGHNSWPLRNSGKLLAQCSNIANSLHKIGMLITQLLSEKPQFVVQNKLEYTPEKEFLVEAVCKLIYRFEEQTNESLFALIEVIEEEFLDESTSWVASLLNRVVFTGSEYLREQISDKNARILESAHLSEIRYTLPLDIRKSGIHSLKTIEDSEYSKILDQLEIERTVHFNSLQETNIYDQAKELDQQSLTIVQLSYMAHFKKIRVSSLSHPSVKHFYPLLESIHDYCFDSNWKNYKVMVLEGVSTLYFLNGQDRADEGLFNVLNEVPKNITLPDLEIQSQPNLQIVDSAQNMCTRFLLWPINDLNAIHLELKALKLLREMLSDKHSSAQSLFNLLEGQLSEMISNTSFNPLHFEPLQRLVWYVDPNNKLTISDESIKLFLSTVMQEAILEWNRTLWANGHTFWNQYLYDDSLKTLVNGEIAPLIYKEVEINLQQNHSDSTHPLITSQAGVIFSMTKKMDDVPLYSLESKLEQLVALQKELSKPSTQQADILNLDTDMLIYQLSNFFSLLNTNLQMEGLSKIVQSLSLPYSKSAFEDIVSSLESLEIFSEIVKGKLLWIFNHLYLIVENPIHDEHFTRGMLWVSYAYCFINTYIPDFPMDPVEGRKAKIHFLSKEMDELISELLIEQEYQFVTFGNSNVYGHQEQMDRIQNIQTEQKKLKFKMPLRPEISQMKNLYLEMQNLKNNVLSDQAINNIASALHGSKVGSDKEDSLQELLGSIAKRLQAKYPHYSDLLHPLLLSIYHMKYGFRFLKQKDWCGKNHLAEGIMEDQLQFVKLYDEDRIMKILENIEKLPTQNTQQIQSKLSVHLGYLKQALSFKSTFSTRNKHLHTMIHQQFNSIVNLWSFAEEQRLAKIEQDQSLYKARVNEFQTSDEFDEEEFLKLFPDFQQEFADLDIDPDSELQSKPSATPQVFSVFSEKVSWHICDLFDRLNSENSRLFSKEWSSSYENLFDTAVTLSQQYSIIPPGSVDILCRSGFLVAAKWHIDRLTHPLELNDKLYDFYNDSNVYQARKLKPVILSYESALNKALAHWPSHAVLNNLALICRRIISFPVTSPIMKLLTGLELLLVKSEDWENYSSKEFSLKSELLEVTNLIIQWRKLELETWRELLEIENRKCSERAAAHWFHLWKIVIGLAGNKEADLAANDICKDVLQSLDEFLVTSSIGEFKARMKMIESFRNYMQSTNSIHNGIAIIEFVQNALNNVHAFYQQFVPMIDQSIEQIRKPILKELREYVKIATWKDINVFALKESAKRTHHHLNKFVKKYRLELQLRVKEIIARYHENMPVLKPIEKIDSTVGKLQSSALVFVSNLSIDSQDFGAKLQEGRLSQLQNLYEKSKHFALEISANVQYIDTISNLNEFGTTIIDRIKEFQSINSSLSAESKTAKGQKMIRKKALVDLLKALTFIGLNSRCSQKYIAHQDSVYMHSHPEPEFTQLVEATEKYGIASNSVDLKPILDRADIYYCRNIARLGAVRKLLSSHSPDISTLEMEKFVAYLDDLLHMSLDQRAVFSSVSPQLVNVIEHITQLKTLDESLESGKYLNLMKQASKTASDLFAVLTQTVLVLQAVDGIDPKICSAFNNFSVEVSQIVEECREHKYFIVNSEVTPLPTLPIRNLVSKIQRSVSKCTEIIETSISQYPNYRFILSPLMEFLNSSNQLLLPTDNTSCSNTLQDCLKELDACIEKTLLVIQRLRVKKEDVNPEENEENELGWKSKQLATSHAEILSSVPANNIALLGDTLKNSCDTWSKFLTNINGDSTERKFLLLQLQRFYPLVHQCILMTFYRLQELVLFHKSVVKFQYILSNTFYGLLKDGFCIPKDEDQNEDEGDLQDNVEGMGIGEGEGKKDVSDEIENQDEVEGLKNDTEKAPPPDKNDLKEEDDAIEMENDFDGALEDVSDDENQENEEEDENREDPDEQMGNLDDDLADVIDEKMWGDEDQDQGNGKDEKTERDSALDNPSGELETAAQEDGQNEDEKKKDSKEQPTDKKEEPQEASTENQEDQGKINEDTEDKYEDSHGIDVKEDHGLDENQDDEMDLPEDLELDGDEDGMNNMPEDDMEDANPEQEQSEEMDVDKPDTQGNLEDSNLPDLEELEQETETPDNEGDENSESPENENEDEEESPENEPAHGLGDTNPEIDDNQDQGELQGTDAQDQSKAESNQPFGVEGKGGDRSIQDQQNNAGNSEVQDSVQDLNTDDARGEKTNKQVSKSEMKDSSNKQDISSQPNPHRSVGNAMEKWLSRLRDIADSVKENQPQNQPESKQDIDIQNADFEYVKEDDEDQGDHQALGVADKEQLDKMDKAALGEEENENQHREEESMDMDDMDKQKEPTEPTATIEPSTNEQNKGVGGQLKSKVEDEEEMEVDREEYPDPTNDDLINEVENSMKITHLSDTQFADDDRIIELGDSDKVLDYDQLRLILEQKMSEWRKSGQDPQVSKELWKNYTTLTRDFSFLLCEQLRLILEPTLSTKLKGDYRTGKRLNMRKIISYIASQFKKDKIWLRRTKPSKRTYQIMIAIDDSLSMSSTHSVQLAYESLTLITNALAQLEVGEISVLSFGEEVLLLHPFEKPWSDEAGAQVIQSFTFKQEKTKVKLLMEQSLEILRHSRQLSQTSDLWQLQLILSDGLCDDHEYIKARVRAAAEERIAIVFIMLDTRPEKDSILNMSSVSYDFDSVTNKPILKVERYMDTFPFDYYVVVRNIEKLPEILSDTLRQFFMFINQ
ncbi:hypothetical protein HK103_006043 [Boothiomyces macroporosus]|uniref:Midasin n=1 Tax=Boothiomyces macroporosus TaxID=261099 RepID=A0AAD5UEC4_9FUNG|nr:hypothetical protein HK103_006043 [Boothiomyces macroporosus]